ncbi:hypothetical protein GCM10009819_10690 [Agromyces tropicus]|uniref:Uncharacterized protein n=1 Tax=Agromyces tropicus TaxID=555371 RepID=A0ABN2U547_9MICO
MVALYQRGASPRKLRAVAPANCRTVTGVRPVWAFMGPLSGDEVAGLRSDRRARRGSADQSSRLSIHDPIGA